MGEKIFHIAKQAAFEGPAGPRTEFKKIFHIAKRADFGGGAGGP